jgi:hypothetical protein
MRIRWIGLGSSTGNGTGLQGDYYTGTNFQTLSVSRTDPTVNFSWTGSPDTGLPADNFSVRWTGFVMAQSSETYTFTTNSDDGVRLWVNGQPLVDNWTFHASTENSGQISLQAGQSYSIRMDFFEGQRARRGAALLVHAEHPQADHPAVAALAAGAAARRRSHVHAGTRSVLQSDVRDDCQRHRGGVDPLHHRRLDADVVDGNRVFRSGPDQRHHVVPGHRL